MTIKSLPPEERPREKLESYGVKFLKNYELLAIILGRGNRREDVLSISSRIMSRYWTEPSLFNRSNIYEIMDFFKISYVQACQIIAVFELGKRLFQNRKDIFLRTPEEVYSFVKDISRNEKEILRGLYLNSRNKLIWDEIISIGTIDSSIAHPREILAPAIKYKASAFIIIHNHPSGDPNPSNEDELLTRRIYKASQIMQIDFLDHIIIGENTFYSFRKHTDIWNEQKL